MQTPRSRWCERTQNRLVILSLVGAVCWLSPIISQAQTLAESLDALDLIWSTGGSANWTGQTDVAFDEIAAAKSGAINDNEESWLQTTVVGPGTVSFWWKVSSQTAADFLQFFIGSNLQQQISGSVDWQYREFNVPAGTNVLKWRYAKDASLFGDLDRGWVDQVVYRSTTPPPFQQTLNTCGVTWTSGGNNNPTFWTAQTNVTHSGGTAVRSGAIYHRQESWLEAVVSGATNVSFWWKVSSEEDSDLLEFRIGTNIVSTISGEVDWQFNTFSLAPGTNILRWRYSKDDGVTTGADRGWLDQVVLSPSSPALAYGLTSPQRLGDGRFTFAITGEVGCACSVQISSNLTDWIALSNFTTTNASHPFVDGTSSNSVMRFYRALSP